MNALSDHRTSGLELDLPEGWFCLDVREPNGSRPLGARIEDLRAAVRVRDESLPADGDEPRSTAAGRSIGRIVDSGAECLLVRPATGDDALPITGGVLVRPPFGIGAAEIFAALDQRGESVALGDLDGMPVVSLVQQFPAASTCPVATVHVTYLLCDEQVSVVLTFTAAARFDPERVVREVARVVSRAHVVR